MATTTETVLYDELTTLFADAPSHRRQFIRFVSEYIDKNIESLDIIGPYKKLIFLEAIHEKPLYAMFGVTPAQIKKVIKGSATIQSNFRTLNNPFFFMLTALMAVFGTAGGRENEEAARMAGFYMGLRFYSSRQQHLFPHEANRDVMEYTVNNLNNKYLLKTLKNVFLVLKHFADSNYETVGERLRTEHTDDMFTYFITNISSKINNMLKNIRDAYDKNYKDKKFLAHETEKHDDEDQTIKELSNLSATIMNVAERVYMKLKDSSIDDRMLSDATSVTKLRVISVKHTLEELLSNERDLLKEIITSILQVFFSNTKNTAPMIKSKYFMNECLNAYKVSNSKNQTILRIKAILDQWIREYGAKYIRLNREATLINFRKAIYIYLVDAIIIYS